MKKLLLIFLLFPSLLLAQKPTNHADFVTITIKIVDYYIDESIFVDAPLTIEDALGQEIMSSKTQFGKEVYQKIGEGHYQVALKAGKKYIATALQFVIDCDIIYEDTSEEIDLSNAIGGDEANVMIRLYAGGDSHFDNVNFNTNTPQSAQKPHLQKAILTIPKLIETCNAMVAFLMDYPKGTIKLEAHTDSTEPNAEQLSKWRALAVKNYLVEKGINPKRIEMEYFGSASPMAPNDTDNNRALNRRVMSMAFSFPDPCPEKE